MNNTTTNPPLSYSAFGHEKAVGEVIGASLLTQKDWAKPWHIAYCRPRQEKALARELIELGITYFLPMVERQTTSGGRKRTSMLPLFASYLFFGAEEEDRLQALRTNRILHFLPTSDLEQNVLKQELAALEACLYSQPKKVELYNHLVVGKRVRVTGGAMKDWEGTVLDASRPHKIGVGVTTLGGGIVVELHGDMLVES